MRYPGDKRPFGSLSFAFDVRNVVVALLAGAGAACTPGSFQAPAVARIDQVVRWDQQLVLEETNQVRLVTPNVQLEPDGGFLVADVREHVLSRYDAGGRLVQHLGRFGRGPGEFERLMAGVRVPGAIWCFEMSGEVEVFDSSGAFRRSVRLPLAPLYNATRLDDSTIVLTGRRRDPQAPGLIHLLNVKRDSIVRSFFGVPQHDPELSGAYAISGATDVALRQGRIAAVFALADTVYLYGADGTPDGKRPIPFKNFRKLTRNVPHTASAEDLRAWRESYSRVGRVFWLRDGSFLVSYFDMDGVEAQWRLLHMDSAGTLLFDLPDSPRLLAVAPRDSRLFFLNPQSPGPNQWSVAHLLR